MSQTDSQPKGASSSDSSHVEVRLRAGDGSTTEAPAPGPLAFVRRFWRTILIVVYQFVLLVFIMAELGVPGLAGFRATNQVLLLVALLFLPFVLLATGSVINSVTFRSGGRTYRLLVDHVAEVKKELAEVRAQVRESISGKVSDAESVLFSVLAGDDPRTQARLERGRVLVGSKTFPSSQALAGFLAAWLERFVPEIAEAAAIVPNGSTLQNYADLRRGAIDLYVEYTGTAAGFLGVAHRDGDHHPRTPERMIEELNARTRGQDIVWLPHLGATDNYRVVMRRADAEKRGISSLTQLVPYAGDLCFGTATEGFNRRDGVMQLQDHYGLRFGRIEVIPYDTAYDLLRAGSVDVILGWQTHAQLKRAAEFAPIADDRSFYPEYYALPAVRAAVLERFPAMRAALEKLAGVLSTQELQELSDRILLKGGAPEVAVHLGRAHARAVAERLGM